LMERRTALVRLADAAGQALPFGERLRLAARRAKDEIRLKLLGADFEQRTRVLDERYSGIGADPFGFDPETARQAAMLCAFFHRMYFRTEVYGIERIPSGKALLIANHSGQIPIDAAIIGCGLFFDANPPRVVRAMVEKWTATLPFVSAFFNRVGQVVGIPENALRLLERGEVVLAVIGAEEQYISFGNLEWAARALGLPVFPIVPQVLMPGGALPLPTKYRLHFGEPMYFHGNPDDDDAVIAEKVWLVQEAIADLLRRGLARRRGVFF
jgi:1-acyl-sn-glycerol-3-phosphate acyltransferase